MLRFRHFLLWAGATVALACSCHKDPSEPEPAGPADPDNLLLVVGNVSSYAIAYAGDSNNAKGLVTALKNLTGADLAYYRETEKTAFCEILLGKTSRPETAEALSVLGGQAGYVIRPVGEKLVIAGTNDVWTALALHAFQRMALQSSDYLSNGSLIIPKTYEHKQPFKDPMLIARLLQMGYSFTLRATQVLSCPGENGMTVAQGAASDGSYFYFVNRTSNEGKSIVYKYSMSSLQQVAKSEPFYAGHCNDMTYDDTRRQLIIAHGQSEGKILTPVDAETLSVQPDVTIGMGSGAITYNAFRGQYAISQGGSTFYVTDGAFKKILGKTRTDDHSGYTAQGMGSDDSYVYFPMSGSKDNALVVYDWNGNYVKTLSIPLTIESESMFYAAGNYYVNFYSKGAQLYRIDPVYAYKYAK